MSLFFFVAVSRICPLICVNRAREHSLQLIILCGDEVRETGAIFASFFQPFIQNYNIQ